MAKKRKSDKTDDELKKRGMFVGKKATSWIGGAAEIAPQYKTAGGAGGRTLNSPEALIADAEWRESNTKAGIRGLRLARIREESAARKIIKRK